MFKPLSLQAKTVAVTGASGALGSALIQKLLAEGARVIALTTAAEVAFDPAVEIWQWQLGQEATLAPQLHQVEILILNHGVNVHGDRSPAAIQKSLEVNALSVWRWLELFLATVNAAESEQIREVWINTSEAEVGPAVSPLYEVSKRLIGELITLRRLDSPCLIRKLILGPFKSQLNPIGIMTPDFVAGVIVRLAEWGFQDIIITINPLTYVAFPLKEWTTSLYFRWFSKKAP